MPSSPDSAEARVLLEKLRVYLDKRYGHAVVSGKEPNGKEWWMPSDEMVESISGRARAAFERLQGKT